MGVTLAAEEINASGGIMGKQIDLVFMPLAGNVGNLVKEGKVKAYGINSAEAKSRDGLLGLENRVAMMNAIAKDAMDRAIKDNPLRASTGAV